LDFGLPVGTIEGCQEEGDIHWNEYGDAPHQG
jgi:hypothetical protein